MNKEILEKIKEIIFKAVCSKNIYSDQAIKIADDAFSKIEHLLQAEKQEDEYTYECGACTYNCKRKGRWQNSLSCRKANWQLIKK